MGQTLSFPATQKSSESGADERLYYAVSEMQGWRISMEDAHAAVLDLGGDEASPNAFFAVYDGHGGSNVAKYAGTHVHQRLTSEEAYKERKYEDALKNAFLGTDKDLLAAHAREPAGCTAVAALVTSDKIYVANAGDSRSVIGVKGEYKALSFDHKPTSETEKRRIFQAGGYVEFGRVNGNLALSRALGDFEFKKNYSLSPEEQIITANPDITCHEITDDDEFLVLACDGIWDCLTSQQVVDFIRYQVSQGKELQEICEMMCDHCLAPDSSSGTGIGFDNMTVLIVALLHGRTKEQWYEWITDRVKNEYGYKTPTTLPQLYSPHRIAAFKNRKAAIEERDRARNQEEEFHPAVLLGGAGLSGYARVLSSTGGISFSPGSSIMSDTGNLMFASDDDSDEDESGEEEMSVRSYFHETLGLGGITSSSTPNGLKLNEVSDSDSDGESHTIMVVNDEPNLIGAYPLQGEAPPPPRTLVNGDARVVPVPQLHSLPGGDAPSAAVKAEGFLDASEDPLKA
ncbi:hypothetical protein AX16_003041 [Volvariella volvacea WC 439]|nr:hypothetical protein AX16_003041 [Volvariella volvacea WC 439]